MTVEIKNRDGSVIYTSSGRIKSVWAATQGAVDWGVSLANANLSGADLAGVSMSGVNLAGADLGGADLCGANLNEANLHGANLEGADLRGAFLACYGLMTCNLYNAKMDEKTVFKDLGMKP